MVALISGYCCRSSIISKMPSPKVTIKIHVIKQYFFHYCLQFWEANYHLNKKLTQNPLLPHSAIFFFLHLKNIFFFFTGGQLLFSVVFLLYSKVNLVCACVHTCVCMYTVFQFLSHLGHHRAQSRVLCPILYRRLYTQ